VSIVNPSPAPDPQGLGEALKLMATSSLFRDMSGRTETADLLKKLSDNSVKFAEIAEKALHPQGPSGAQSGPSSQGTSPNSQHPPTSTTANSTPVGKSGINVPNADEAIVNAAKAIDTAEKLAPKDKKVVHATATKSINEALSRNSDSTLINIIFKHKLTNVPLIGYFNAMLDLNGDYEIAAFQTDDFGMFRWRIPRLLKSANYSLSLTGHRSKPPSSIPLVFKIEPSPSFQGIELPLTGNFGVGIVALVGSGGIKVTQGSQTNVTVLCTEDKKVIQHSYEYSRTQGVNLTAGFNVKANFDKLELGGVNVSGMTIDTGTNTHKTILNVDINFLTGGFEIVTQ
jgi:hypothetical protein